MRRYLAVMLVAALLGVPLLTGCSDETPVQPGQEQISRQEFDDQALTLRWPDRVVRVGSLAPAAEKAGGAFIEDRFAGAVLRWIAGDGEHVEHLEVTLSDGTALTYRFPGGDLGGTMPEELQRCPVDVARGGAVYRTTADRLPVEVRLQLDRLAAAGRQWQAHHGAPDVSGAVAKRNPFKKIVDVICAVAREINGPGAPRFVPVIVGICDVLCYFLGWGC